MEHSAVKKMLSSITSNDSYILFFALFVVLLLILAFICAHEITKYKSSDVAKNVVHVKRTASGLRVINSLIVTFISIFPLLGMFGTVSALLSLDLSSGDMSNLKVNFFAALTSTAWGIVFSVVFKLFYSLIVDYIEAQLEDAVKLTVSEDIPAILSGR
ncbi:MotA/TolQ/ExbB proton channel family protein [Gemmiger sp.]